MTNDQAVMAKMREFAPSPVDDVVARIETFSTEDLRAVLTPQDLSDAERAEISEQWDIFRRDEQWCTLLGALVAMIEAARGDIDAPITMWPDLEESGGNGRLFYFFLFALCAEGTVETLRELGVPSHIIDRTLGIVARHAAIHRREYGTTGVNNGWWLVPTLRGEMLHVGSLQFHLVTLGVGSLSPVPWYGEEVAAGLGVGFRRGDPSIGIHVPDGTDLSHRAVDETFQEARELFAQVWPARERRLGTFRSWMLDDQLKSVLSPASRILAFRRRFNLVPGWIDDDEDAIEFVFRSPGTALGDLPRTTSLQRSVIGIVQGGGHCRIRTGWLEFDGH
jgi:hypothetical protein